MSAAPEVIDPTQSAVQAGTEGQAGGGDNPGTSTRLIHFLQDGFTAFAQVWYRGQELEVDAKHFQETLDTNGVSWLDLLAENEQIIRFGQVMFRPGPWPFDEYDDEQAAQKEKGRARRPRL